MLRKAKRWWLLLLLMPVLALAGFVLWANTPLGPMPEAVAALQSDEVVQVEMKLWFVFRPKNQVVTTGLILYPGGRIDPRSYAPAGRAISAEGYLVVIVPMPLNLAVIASERATAVIAAFPEVRCWAIGGHSLGGAMAARYTYQHPKAVQGLVLWAAYPASSDDLSERNLAVVSIYGSLDGLAAEASIASSRALLPPTTRWVNIEGGNHAQMGWYGPQTGDRAATINREEQQKAVVSATVEFLGELARRGCICFVYD